jgi:hypothetical protein
MDGEIEGEGRKDGRNGGLGEWDQTATTVLHFLVRRCDGRGFVFPAIKHGETSQKRLRNSRDDPLPSTM